MLDIKYIKENPEEVIARLAKKGKDGKNDIEMILSLDAQRRAIIGEVEVYKAQKNKVSAQIPALKKEGKPVDDIFAEMRSLGDKIAEGKKQYALSFVLQDLDKTLTDNDVEKVMSKLLSTFQNEFGATLR